MLRYGTVVLLFCVVFPGMIGYARERDSGRYLMATANTAGTYYPVGVALATLTKVKLEPEHSLSLNAISSAGSAENLELLRDDSVQFAILQGLYGYWAWNGIGPFRLAEPRRDVRSITMLWHNVEHFVVKSDYLVNGTMDDLEGLKRKRFSLGARDSGSAGSGYYLLQELGFVPEDDFELQYLDYGASTEAIRSGEIEAMNIPGGPPVEAVSRAIGALGKDVTVLEFSDEQLERANRKYKLWSRYIIEPYTYPGQDEAVRTIAQPNFLAVRSDVPDVDVYRIVKAMYANLEFLHAIHPITRAMKIEAAINGLPVPLHPGAARFYREQGVDIPDELIAR
ncbi:TAXI family TRAP transporter solute-binding subunit [Desulfopila sp. IMCC35008]|uniref:TAXI family TRAP transporter solute-binding subunit n=1 Tax=Desulfopila sp. IMCC35008 TaxID=2653858 RepID=UPI0013D2934A|nr:TAXI family TRAP transporter solute-binding subunit [Desulfopila sp. IMCC35008]